MSDSVATPTTEARTRGTLRYRVVTPDGDAVASYFFRADAELAIRTMARTYGPNLTIEVVELATDNRW